MCLLFQTLEWNQSVSHFRPSDIDTSRFQISFI